MPSAEIITIGTEILLGEIVDTNARYLARALRDAGIDLYRKTSVGDNAKRIALAIQQSLERCDIVITTGGLGAYRRRPHSRSSCPGDGRRDRVSPRLMGTDPIALQAFWPPAYREQPPPGFCSSGSNCSRKSGGYRADFHRRVRQPVVISLPGVPREMEYLLQHAILPYLQEHYHIQGIIKARVLHTAGTGESQIDELVGDLEELGNPTVGLAAHSGQVDVRITAKADSPEAADELIKPVEKIIRDRLGNWIYGADQEIPGRDRPQGCGTQWLDADRA